MLKIEQIPDIIPSYSPAEDERAFLHKIYDDYRLDSELKNQSHAILNNKTLQKFWDDSLIDSLNYVEADPSNSWKKKYPDGITRDKVNVFLSNLANRLSIPQIFAQNPNQEIDNIMSRVLKILVEWSINNDGRPFDNGHIKFIRANHKSINEGTVHKLITVNENKDHETELIPNEEVFISNYWEPNIQKQDHFIWVKENITYEAAKAEFGDLENFKYVVPGSVNEWNLHEDPFFKNYETSIVEENRVEILRCWYPVSKKRGQKSQKYFNVCINGVLMFDLENKDPHNHGYYPIVKTVFEMFDSHFYWGNSLPNKIRQDKRWADGLRSIIFNKAKLSMLPPILAKNGTVLERDVYVPSKITQLQGDPQKDLMLAPGVQPILQGEIALLDSIYKSADNASASQITSGQMTREQRTLGEIELVEANATRLMNLFGLMIASLVEQEGYLLCKNIIQFYPRKKISDLVKVSIPNQTLKNGLYGDIEVLFGNKDLNNEEEKMMAQDILMQENKAKKKGKNKEIIYINTKYAQDLTLFVEIVGNPVERHSAAMERYLTIQKYTQVYMNNPLINQEQALRKVIRSQGDDEEILIQPQQQMQPSNLMSPTLATPTPQVMRGSGMNQMMAPKI